ncbi:MULTISPECIES: hypothetical protein [unclassified Curtobacterium]|uniref:hypothetical protein n=1 Tax=unclassified Curtobacterium TaxID=257496 RepID=UPI0009F68ABD|nr:MULTISPECIES: hypothetical protein [unclassified Curtobacterium]WIA96274.1 hypothetical protein QOL16_14360 [Curtobacterium sp. MCBA15_004]WIA99575.1 hypothetical protein QOL15_13780 [Curtobacterium sp. MCBA15_012]
MTTSEITAGGLRAGHRFRLAARIGTGLVVGVVAVYVVAVIATAPLGGDSTTHPLVLAGLALVGAAAVAVGTRWPTVGVTAGAVVLLVTVFAVVQRVSWTTGTTQWLSPTDALGYAAVSAHPAMVGAVLVSAAVVRGRRRSTSPDR